MNASQALAEYRAAEVTPDPRYAWPDGTAAAERRAACEACARVVRDGGLLRCDACKNCKKQSRVLNFTLPLARFACPDGRWLR